MAASSVTSLVRESSNSLKSILTSQDFGSEYQLLCTELSLQLLRIRLWAESVGIHIDDPGRGDHGIFDRPEVKKPITRAVNSIAVILNEINILRRKYDLKPKKHASTGSIRNPSRFLQSYKSRDSLPSLPSFNHESHKPRSFLSLAKWAISDARKFQEKVRNLKGLIDSLEDISKSVALGQFPQIQQLDHTQPDQTQTQTDEIQESSDESPPPYASPARTRRRTNRPSQAAAAFQMTISRVFEEPEQGSDQHMETAINNPPGELPAEPVVRRSTSVYGPLSENLFSEHYTALKTYLTGIPAYAPRPSREKLFALSESQLQGLSTDIYDDLLRRQQYNESDDHLQEDPNFRPKRNQARARLATLRSLRFGHLVSDLVGEMERRVSDIHKQCEQPNNENLRAPGPLRRCQSEAQNRTMSTLSPIIVPSWGNFDDGVLPPTPLRVRKSFPTRPTNPEKPQANCSNPSAEFIKSFRVSMNSPTSEVLPVAMAKYGIQGRWQQYSLYIRCPDQDRCLGLDEKPLMVFKKLKKQGNKPVFMLKKREAKAPIFQRMSGGAFEV
ncbi:uncharacterized protein BP5553_02698 [Venustampulla echinocandica]|uniref:Ras-associating domain-containing protein n=1 Tax=Venustampulla echinocandica TaxID=2656787 RepID=A0A370TS86_9HELO|nr:uncharacterized protein BP5553_02698 [Venustampulla echinocandica]RDL38358.1 hypothetical protein BP5553_02698 [Venustampulla echinocandica]